MEEEIRKLEPFFNPKSVAIIGATKKVDKAGYVIFKNIANNKLHGVFKGELYPVNPSEDSILGFKCYPSITSDTKRNRVNCCYNSSQVCFGHFGGSRT